MNDIDKIISIGVSLFILWFVLLLITYFIQLIVSWVDDKDVGNNIVIQLIMEKIGYELYDGCFKYKKGDEKSEGDIAVFLPALILLFSPLFIYLYQLTLPIVLFVLLLHLTRFVRRLQKKFNAHCSDSSIHKH